MINHEIKSEKVKLITDGSATEMSTQDALNLAEEQELDLICINENNDIPVVIIDNYGSYLYNKNKKKKEQNKKARLNAIDNKEIQISNSIADHDLAIKASKIDKMLIKGSRIKLVIRYRGREKWQIQSGPEKLQALVDKVTENYKIVSPAKIEGNQVAMTIITAK